jgi:hypothetical protein
MGQGSFCIWFVNFGRICLEEVMSSTPCNISVISNRREPRKKACLFQGKLSFPIRLHLGYISGSVILVYPQGSLTVDMCPAYRSRIEIRADLLKH